MLWHVEMLWHGELTPTWGSPSSVDARPGEGAEGTLDSDCHARDAGHGMAIPSSTACRIFALKVHINKALRRPVILK